jgi:hypothetical protein
MTSPMRYHVEVGTADRCSITWTLSFLRCGEICRKASSVLHDSHLRLTRRLGEPAHRHDAARGVFCVDLDFHHRRRATEARKRSPARRAGKTKLSKLGFLLMSMKTVNIHEAKRQLSRLTL